MSQNTHTSGGIGGIILRKGRGGALRLETIFHFCVIPWVTTLDKPLSSSEFGVDYGSFIDLLWEWSLKTWTGPLSQGKMSKIFKMENEFDNLVVARSDTLKGYILKRSKNICSQKTCRRMFSVTLFTVAQNWKKPKCPSIGEWTNYGLFIRWNITQQ